MNKEKEILNFLSSLKVDNDDFCLRITYKMFNNKINFCNIIVTKNAIQELIFFIKEKKLDIISIERIF